MTQKGLDSKQLMWLVRQDPTVKFLGVFSADRLPTLERVASRRP